MSVGLWNQTVSDGKPPSLLDTVESPACRQTASATERTVDCRPTLTDNFRHSGWRHNRERTYAAMLRVDFSHARLAAFAGCGSGLWVLRHKEDLQRFRVVADHCHDRFCVPCCGQRQAIIRRNLDHYLPNRPHRFLTLTLRHQDEPLDYLLTRLYKCFKKLRGRRFWKDRVRGGAAFLEITYNAETHGWHPHLHCMLDGLYLDLGILRKLWLAITGDSHQVKINLIRTRREVVSYVTKYATKPVPPSVVQSDGALDEALKALRHRRTILTFGTWRNWKLTDDPQELDWTSYGHLDAIRYRATDGDLLCQNILDMMKTADPHTGEFMVDCHGPPLDEPS